ncbi:MAG: DUF1566 domain-containing protein [Geobacteraceae bacterium]
MSREIIVVFLMMVIPSLTFADAVQPPQTGQSRCYDIAGALIPCFNTAQDGELKAGSLWPSVRFTDNGNGTVTDNLTGLDWSKDANAPGPDACAPGTAKIWEDALVYISCLNNNSYLGFTDWRLPNINELGSLLNFDVPHMETWLGESGFINVQSWWYWSSTSQAYDKNKAWSVSWPANLMNVPEKNLTTIRVWPVRTSATSSSAVVQLPATGQITCFNWAGGEIPCAGTGQDGELKKGAVWPVPRITDNGDGTMTDNLTGLVWTKDAYTPGPFACVPGPAAKYFPWQGALDYIVCLNDNSYLGHNDWRLPNVNELRSLIDYSQPVDLCSQEFLNYQGKVFWTGTSNNFYTSNAIMIDFVNYGSNGSEVKSNGYTRPAWPVRGGQVNKSYFPDPPLVGSATANYGKATITFTPPANNGGSAITSYTVTSDPENKTATGTSSPITITGLTEGQTYSFTVTATNAVGTGAASSPSNSVTLKDFPGAPTGATAFAADSQATVRFIAPVDIGGSAITGYTVTSFPGSFIATGKTSPITVTGLANGSDYTFTVAATNTAGTGPESSPSNSVTVMKPAFIINNGSLYTKSATVRLTLSFPSATSMCFNTTGKGWSSWENYSPTKSLTLPSGDDLKTVLVNFRDKQRIGYVYSAAIFLDTKAPTNGTLTITPASGSLSLNWTGFNDATSGIKSYRLVAGTSSAPACSATPIYTGPDTSFSHTNLTLNKTYHYRVCAIDAAGNISTGATATWKVLSEYTPPAGTVVINNNAPYTRTAKVNLTINADDNGGSGLSQMCISNTSTCTAWIPYATSKAWTLATGDGPKTVNIQFKDKNGNATAPADAYHSNSIILDTKPPLGTITINGGAYSTNDPNVTLSLSVADVNGVTLMQFSTNNNWTGVPWETFALTKAYTVPATPGVRTVYARFKDFAGNVSAVCSDTIIYSATPPPTGTAGAVTINGGAQFTTTTAAQLAITSPDPTFTRMRFCTNGTTWTAWETLKPTKSLALPGGDGVKTVYAKFSDAGGTESGIYMDTIILDTKPPVGTISINGGAATTTNQLVTLSLSAADANGVTDMQFSTNNKWTGLGWEDFAPTKTFNLGTSTPGNKSVYVRFRDAAGNISTAYSDSIKLVAP